MYRFTRLIETSWSNVQQRTSYNLLLFYYDDKSYLWALTIECTWIWSKAQRKTMTTKAMKCTTQFNKLRCFFEIWDHTLIFKRVLVEMVTFCRYNIISKLVTLALNCKLNKFNHRSGMNGMTFSIQLSVQSF